MPTQIINGNPTSYTERGQGEAIVLLHGFPLDSGMWAAQLEALSDRRRVIAPDFRGFGRSGATEGPTDPRPTPLTIESLADDTHLLLEQIDALPVVLCGLSMGGYVALAYAKKYPADLGKLILIDTKAEADNTAAREGRQKMIDVAHMSGAGAVAEAILPKLVAEETTAQRPGVVSSIRSMIESCPVATIVSALHAMRDRPDLTATLESISVPTLILVGDRDTLTPPAVAGSMHKAIAGSKYDLILGAGHMSPMEKPDQVNDAIRRFLDG